MLDLPTSVTHRTRAKTRRDSWHLAGWARLTGSTSHATPGQVLSAAVAVLAQRYGVPCELSAGPGCGTINAARALVEAAPLEATWTEVLDAVCGGAPPPPAGPADPPPVPTIHVAMDAHPDIHADLVWITDGERLEAVWDEAVYPEQSVELMARHLDRLAGELVRSDAPPLGRVCFLTAEERKANGGTPETLPVYPPITLHQLFMLQAWRTPDVCALRLEADSLTYRELDNSSSRLAHRLVDAGVGPGDVVAVGGERTLGLFAALIAVLKAGGVFVYLDPAYPAQRLAQFIDISGPRLLLTGPGAVPVHSGLAEIAFPGRPDRAEVEPISPPEVLVGAESPAYLLFTSGSTGVPKGVLRPHRLHTSRIFLEQGMYPLGVGDRVLVKAVISAREVFWPLAVGATLVIARPGGERDDEYILDLIRDERISVVSAPGAWLQTFAVSPRLDDCRSLRHLFAGGEVLHRVLEDRLIGRGFTPHNTYTLTEADYVIHRSGPAASCDYHVMGKPLDMRVYLCDEHGRLVPPGLVGEIWTGGPGLSTGYYRDEERTAQRFVPNPFGDPQAPTLCRTGDLARGLPDGTLEYRGRRDLQVKIRGQRVEPTEVETWIKRHPAVRNAAVAGYPDEEQGAVLVAYVVYGEVQAADGELRGFLLARVPEYMVPRHFVRLPALPLLANGKIDRASLRVPERARPAGLPAPIPAQTAVQQRLLRLWERILRTPGIGIDDDYTSVGGDSLRVLLLRAAIQDEFSAVVDLAALLNAPTVRAQAGMLEGRVRSEAVAPAGAGALSAAVRERARRGALSDRRRAGEDKGR